jgi:ADP-heptose:LPS heptosyltransferase
MREPGLQPEGLRRIAREILDRCLAGSVPDELPRELIEDPAGQALFGILAEGLADRFEPALCDAYAHLFAPAIAEGGDAADLVARYQRVRQPRLVAGEPRRVFVLSRVTLGADVAVTSVLLDAAKRRFPDSTVVFVGPLKNYELFARDPRIQHAAVSYRRGALHHRLAVRDDLRDLLSGADSLVLDPDSRLTQLGLLPVCAEERYHLFESRSYGGEGTAALPELAARWAYETLGVGEARPYLALAIEPVARDAVAVSLGVGENPAKRIADPFEEGLLRLLAASGRPLWIDKGAGGEEAARVECAVERAGVRASFWDGSFAGFASIVAGSRLYAGYDSAGQHIAAAAGVPLISVFAGFPSARMFDRWRPTGPHCEVVRVERPDPAEVLERVERALQGLRT